MLLLALLVSLVLGLASAGRYPPGFYQLGMVMLFVQWVTLTVAAVWWALGRFAPEIPPGVVLWVLQLGVPGVTAVYGSVVLALGFDLAIEAPAWWMARNVLLSALIAVIFVAALRAQMQLRQQSAAEANIRLEALQARIRPHFLFNALNTIASLIHDRPDRAEQASLDLADLLRTGLKSDEAHNLEDELALIRRYLRLEALRLEERLVVDWQLADDLPLGQPLPPLLLQPLVENAIVHGISRRADGGELRIEGRRIRFARIRFTISNPLADPDSRPVEGNRTALDNIRQRLALAYEERYGLKTWAEDGLFKAELTIPVN
ncbi:MAG: sensor histidine kinase [Wenzhouxiangella sp.]